jgi:hypothetical protein
MLSRFERHQAASYGAAAVPSKTRCRQTLTIPDGPERHRRFSLAVQISRELSIVFAIVVLFLFVPNKGSCKSHSITSAACASTVAGTSTLSAFSALSVRCVLDSTMFCEVRMARVQRLRYSEELVQPCAGALQDDYLLSALRGRSGQAR